jgi:ethanolamine utilization protein EutN
MRLGRIVGTVVATAKHPGLAGAKLLLVQPLARDGTPRGRRFVAVDAVGAGVAETIYWCRGREAALAFEPQVPTDATIVGIVDSVTQGGGKELRR